MSIQPGTPLPWSRTKGKPRKITASGVLICTAVLRNSATTAQNKRGKDEADAEANAAYIVHACNTFPELVEELEAAVEIIDDQLGGYFPDTLRDMKALLRKARGEA